MGAPSFVAEYESAWNNSDPITRSVTVAAGDLLILYGGIHNGGGVLSTPSGGGLTWTLLQTSTPSTSYCTAQIWWAISPTSQTFTISVQKAVTGNQLLGFNVLRFSGASGVGASTKANASSGAPSASLVTTAANSAIVMFDTDWNGRTGARTYRSAGAAFVELSYFQASAWMIAGGYYPDAGAAGAKTIGMTAPTSQKYNLVAVEVKGTADTGPPGEGTGASSLTFDASASGSVTFYAATTASLSLSAAAVGTTTRTGTAGTAVTVTGAADGVAEHAGAADTTWTLDATAVGQTTVAATAAATLTLASAAEGVTVRSGEATLSSTVTAEGVGTTDRRGTAAADLAAIVAAAGSTVTDTARNITIIAGPVTRGWDAAGPLTGWLASQPNGDQWFGEQPVTSWSAKPPNGGQWTANKPTTAPWAGDKPVKGWTPGPITK